MANLKLIITTNFANCVPENTTRINSGVTANEAHQGKLSKKRKRSKEMEEPASLIKMSKVSFQKDKFYAVAYSGGWHPGRCVEELMKSLQDWTFSFRRVFFAGGPS